MTFRSSRWSVCFLLFAVAAGCSGKAAPEPIWIGHLAPLTGPNGATGRHAEQAVDLAVEETNQEDNRIAGRSVAVRHVDLDPDPKAAAVRLVTVNRVSALLGSVEAGPAEALALQAQSYRVPTVVTADLSVAPPGKYLFAIGLAPARRGEALARFVAEKLHKTPVTVLAPDRGPAAAALVDAFAAKLGRERVRKCTYAIDSSGQKAPHYEEPAKQARAQNPEAILIVGNADAFLALRAELLKAGLDKKTPLLFGGDEEQLTTLLAKGPDLDGTFATTAFALDGGTPRAEEIAKGLPRAQAFVTAYRAKFGEAPDANAALAYDAARLLFEAMRRAKSSEGDKVQEQLATLAPDFEGLTGPLSRRPTFVVQIKGGRAEVRELYESR
jgi:branched-chain amino acid transport system substrate-binding protein